MIPHKFFPLLYVKDTILFLDLLREQYKQILVTYFYIISPHIKRLKTAAVTFKITYA